LNRSCSLESGSSTLFEGEAILFAAIIVRSANAFVAPLHDRMPVTLLPKSHHDWLNPDSDLMRLRQLLVARRASSPCPTT
jgi:putative SOS response-associated peptidase YedK